MAMVVGVAGRHALDQAVRVFQKMLLTTMMVLVVVSVMEGVILARLFTGRISMPELELCLCGGLIIWWLCHRQGQQIDRYERERAARRRGQAGECPVAGTLDRLPDQFFVFHDVTTGIGNLDHVVIGPTGLFLIETKNWRGVATADSRGELVYNNLAQSKPCIRAFLARCLQVLNQVKALTHRDELYFKAIMVFPRARVDAPLGSTGRVHCMTDDKLCAYIENEQFSDDLSKATIGRLVRAFAGVARRELTFQREPAGDVAAVGPLVTGEPIFSELK
ncbi:MAG: nuclease-related domain-containing protein [Chthoniobacterales bacterium]